MRSSRTFVACSLGFLLFAGLIRAEEGTPYGDIGDLTLAKPDDKVDVMSVAPPEGVGTIVLFDGKSLDNWVKADGKTPPGAKLVDGGAFQVAGGDIRTKQVFDGRFLVHLEFRVPYVPAGKGQGRGNSGVYLQGRYEIQVLDSYGLDSQKNDCGAIYEVAAPLVNACKAPTVWQKYDIDFTAPRFAAGKKIEPARATVYQNGTLIQNNVPIPVDNTRSGLGGDASTPGPIMIQDHGHPVQYRNIWLIPLNTPEPK